MEKQLQQEESEQRSQLKGLSTFDLVRFLYKNDQGDPFELSPSQIKIFDAIFKKEHKRIWMCTPTQFGKSEVVSMAVLTRVATFPEKFALVAPTKDKAKIIIGYIVKHLFENEYTMTRFKIEKGENVERLRRERSANKLTFDVGNNQVGTVFIGSAESRLRSEEDVGNALMGFGAPNLIMDEAALIDDRSEAKAMRMVGGHVSVGNDFVVKIGNPFKRNHFLKAWEDPIYHKIFIDYKIAIAENRLTPEYIEEMRKKPYFGVLYECKFPAADDIDEKGWTQLLSEDEIRTAMLKEGEEIKHIGEKRLGNDVARGGSNFTAWVMRSMNYMELIGKTQNDNLTETAGMTVHFMRENQVVPENTFIDDVGVGGGAVDPIKYQQLNVRGVNGGEKAVDQIKFSNIRAEAYWRMREWVKKGGRLSNHDEWVQLSKVKYKPDTRGRLRIMSKEEMRGLGIDSPDVADAGVLTFARPEHGDMEQRNKMRFMKRQRRKNTSGGLHLTMAGH